MTAVAVTGAGGYVGGRLVHALTASGRTPVRSLVRTPRPWLDGTEQVAVDLVAGDITPAFEGVECVVHLAGPNEAVAAHEPDRALSETVVSARRVADAAAATGVKRLVYVSTVHVYGAAMTPGARLAEDMAAEPRSVYAIARLASEHLLASCGLPLIVFRLTNSVGAPVAPSDDRWTLVANDLCREAVLHDRVTLRSAGAQWRDFVALADVAAVLADTAGGGGPEAGTYNLGSGTPTTVRQLAELVQDVVERRTGRRPALHAPPPETPAEPYRVDTGRLGATGHTPRRGLADSIDETVRFCLEHREALA